MNILLLCNRTGRSVDATTVTDHLDAFTQHSRHRVQELSFLRELPAAVDLAQFDVVVLHYTIAIGWLSEHYLSQRSRRKLREFDGLKVLFIQDEYRSVRHLHEQLRLMKVDVLFTCVPRGEIEKVYPSEDLQGISKVNCLTGYVPQALVSLRVSPIASRPIDVGYRTRKYPYWLGALAYEKSQIVDRFTQHAAGTGLRLDLSHDEEDRLYGAQWTRFLSDCKAVLGVESGASVFDFEGSLQRDVESYLAVHPNATFDEVQGKFLMSYEGLIRYNQISPRCFEAAALRTVMILYEGQYSGILKPWQHYVPLRRDFGNFSEVLDILRDLHRLQTIADQTYQEVACNEAYSYRTFVRQFDDVVQGEFERRRIRRSRSPYTRTKYLAQLAFSPSHVVHRAYARAFQWLLLGSSRRRIMLKIWHAIPQRQREMVRPLLRWILGR